MKLYTVQMCKFGRSCRLGTKPAMIPWYMSILMTIKNILGLFCDVSGVVVRQIIK